MVFGVFFCFFVLILFFLGSFCRVLGSPFGFSFVHFGRHGEKV